MRVAAVLSALLALSGSAFAAGGWRLYPAADPDPALPRVLIVGDSICNGYRHTVVPRLKGKANVDAWVTPYHIAAPQLLAEYRKILAENRYDVIHFNHGLHGFGKRIPEGKYAELLENLLLEIRKAAPQAKIVWCATTPVNQKGDNAVLDPELNPVVVERNALAAAVMKRHNVPVTDLYTLVVGQPELRAKPEDQYHYNGKGTKLQGEFVAAALARILDAKEQDGRP